MPAWSLTGDVASATTYLLALGELCLHVPGGLEQRPRLQLLPLPLTGLQLQPGRQSIIIESGLGAAFLPDRLSECVLAGRAS